MQIALRTLTSLTIFGEAGPGVGDYVSDQNHGSLRNVTQLASFLSQKGRCPPFMFYGLFGDQCCALASCFRLHVMRPAVRAPPGFQHKVCVCGGGGGC